MSGLRIDTDVEMTTRDGVVLRADVYRPDDDRPRPALLHRTPYDKANPSLVSVLVADPVALARAGYAVVVQDVRGRFASEGVLDFAEQEHDDGYDSVEWAAAQDWCDAQVGIYGSSYHAISAYAALAAAPPHLSAVFAMIGAADLATTVRPGRAVRAGLPGLLLPGPGRRAGAPQRALPRGEARPGRSRAARAPGPARDGRADSRWRASTCSPTPPSHRGGAPGCTTRPAPTPPGRWPATSRCPTCR